MTRQEESFVSYWRTCSECDGRFQVLKAKDPRVACSKECRKARKKRQWKERTLRQSLNFAVPGAAVSRETPGCPYPLMQPLFERQVGVHRRVWCNHYDKCLEAMGSFKSFTCGFCPIVSEIPMAARREEGEFLAKKLKLFHDDVTV